MNSDRKSNSLEGKFSLIAGGAKNLGGRLSRDLATHGAAGICVHYHSDSSGEAAEATVEAVRARSVDAFAVQADLTRPSEVERVFTAATDRFGGLDIAINTAGMVLKKSLTEVTEAEFDEMFDINAKAAFFFLQQSGLHLNDGGKICTIVTSLLGAFTGLYSSYAGSKAPVEHFTRAASKEFGPRGISVTAVGPGPMDTPFFYGQESEGAVAYHSSAADLSPFSSTGLTDVEDIVPLVRFLVSDGWWVTGQTILANGGYTTK